MLNTATNVEAKSATRRKASNFERLIQAAVLAVVLVPLGTVALEAGPITCGFGSYYFLGGEGCSSPSETNRTFDWGPYSLQMTFVGVTGGFEVTVNDAIMSQATFDARVALPDPYDCVTLVAPTALDPGCRDFEISVIGGGDWDRYELEFLWNYNTNTIYPDTFNGTDGHVRVVQNPGSELGNAYTIDMCLTYGCEYLPDPTPIDPGIRTGDTDFSSMAVSWTPVPEPSTLILLGTGVSGLLYRRRQRSQKPEAEPTA